MFDLTTSPAASCIYVKDVASYAIFCNSSCLLVLQNERMVPHIEDRKPFTIVPSSMYSSYICGQRNVFIHKASKYCNEDMFVG